VSALPASLAGEPAAPSVSPAAGDVAPVIEETAILFANGEVEPAWPGFQTRSVRRTRDSALQAWLMLFDLLQHLDMWVEFEALALESW